MLRNSIKRDVSPEINHVLSSDDLEALLKFPFDQYHEENEVEALSNFLLNHDAEQNHEVEEAREEGVVYDQEDVRSITSCLSVNKNIQYRVNRFLSQVQNALERNKTKQVEVKNYLDAGDYKSQFDSKTKTSKPISLFASPYFRDVRGMVPPENEDTLQKRANNDVTAYLQPPRPWMVFEKDKLIEAVHSHCLSYIQKPFKTKRNYLKDKLKEEVKNLTKPEEDSLIKQIKDIEKEILKQSKRKYTEVIDEAKDHIKWHEIIIDGNRSGEECEMMWNNYLSIFINKQPFTVAEDGKLKQLVKEYNGKNWDAIAEDLQTRRSAIQCFERYQTFLNRDLRKKYWTPEEDAKLLNLVESNRIGNFIPWNRVCSQMVGRERHQILNRYERTINKRNKRTRWTKEEDAMLLMCVKKFGCHWTRMKEYIPGRNPYNIRERYVNMLDPYLKCGPWTKAEDHKLTELVKAHGYGKWAIIAKEVPGRTDNMCLIRANCLGLKPRKGKTRKNGQMNGEFSNESEDEHPPRRRRGPRTAIKPSSRMKIQAEALDALKTALSKIAPSVVDDAKETINVPSIPVALLKDLHKELYRNENKDAFACWKPRYLSFDGISKIDFSKQNKYVPKRQINKERIKKTVYEEEEAVENENLCEVEEQEFDKKELMWLHDVLTSQFNEAEEVIKMPAYITKINLNSRHSAECAIYETYLKQKLGCSGVPVEEEDYVFSGNNYNLTLADIVHHFIQPPVLQNSTMVLAPNWATLHGMDLIQGSEKRLHKTGKFIHHSVPYIRYLSGRSVIPPKCFKCMPQNTDACNAKLTMNHMKTNLIVPDEDMEMSAMVENRQLSSQDQECCCKEIAESKTAVDLLAKRFMALFLWPSLLSSNLRPEQEELVVRNKQFIRGCRKRVLSSNNYSLQKKIQVNSCESTKMEVKNEQGESSKVSTVVKSKRQSSNKRRRRSVKQEFYTHKSESDSEGESVYSPGESSSVPINNSVHSSAVPLRRSIRSAVLQRRSFSFVEKDEESL